VQDATADAVIAYQYALNHFELDEGSYKLKFGIEDPLLWAEVELYLLTEDNDYLTAALDKIEDLVPFTDIANSNYWSLRPLAMQEIYLYVDSTTQAHIQELLKSRVDYFISMADDTPYGVQNEFGNFGTNEQLATYMGDLIRYYDLLGDPDVLRAAKRGLYWIFGDNPWKISFVSGVGTDHVDFPHTRLDNESYSHTNTGIVIPGAMVAGPVLKDYLRLEVTNRPWYEDRPLWQDSIQQWRYNEFSISIQAGLLYDGFHNDGLFGGQEINSWENWYNQDGGTGTYSEVLVDGRNVGKFAQNPATVASRAKFQSWHDVSDLSGYRYLEVTMKNTGYPDARINIQVIDDQQGYSVTGGYMSVSNQWTTYQFDRDQFPGMHKDQLKMAIWLRQLCGTWRRPMRMMPITRMGRFIPMLQTSRLASTPITSGRPIRRQRWLRPHRYRGRMSSPPTWHSAEPRSVIRASMHCMPDRT